MSTMADHVASRAASESAGVEGHHLVAEVTNVVAAAWAVGVEDRVEIAVESGAGDRGDERLERE